MTSIDLHDNGNEEEQKDFKRHKTIKQYLAITRLGNGRKMRFNRRKRFPTEAKKQINDSSMYQVPSNKSHP